MQPTHIAIVTGGSRGIGRAICVRLAHAGAAVVACYQGNKAAAEETVFLCEEAGGKATAFCADVTSKPAVDALLEHTKTTYGTPTILVNNAGITRDKYLFRMNHEDWTSVLETNLTGAFNCIHAVTPGMLKARGGRIINITSIVGIDGNAGQTNYAAAKAGLIGLTKAAAKELAPRQITVNAIAPGFIETDMTAALTAAQREVIIEHIGLRRAGTPEDVAAAVLFFVRSGFVTGQVLRVDGGM